MEIPWEGRYKAFLVDSENYLSLFDSHIFEYTLEVKNEAVMKGWSLGSLKFIKKIEKKTELWSKQKQRGVDRKSKESQKDV